MWHKLCDIVHALDLMVPTSKNLTVWAKGEMGICFTPGLLPQGQIFVCRVIPYWNSTP